MNEKVKNKVKVLIWGTGVDYSPILIDILVNMMSTATEGGGGKSYWYNFKS